MKRISLFLLIAFAGAPLAAQAAPSNIYMIGDAASGITSAKHNLGRLNNKNGLRAADGSTEVCMFCHTPHHTNYNLRPAPLWNRVNTITAFTAYGPTMGGSVVYDYQIGSVSQACLSCHDGVTTIDNIINAPGAGGVDMAGAAQRWSFIDAAGNMIGLSPNLAGVEGGRLNIGSGPNMMQGTNLRVDLSNDHPMSVTYSPDRASLRPVSVRISTIDLTTGLNGTSYDNHNLTRNLWAVRGYISDSAVIADLLRNNRVECSSCHDPHFMNATACSVEQGISPALVSPDGLFLRRIGGNVGSGICRTCHNK